MRRALMIVGCTSGDEECVVWSADDAADVLTFARLLTSGSLSDRTLYG